MWGRVFPYQARGECPLAEAPVPTVNEWYTPPPGPTPPRVAPVCLIVVACATFLYPLPAPAIDGWYAPPPEPIPASRAVPALYQSTTFYEAKAVLPVEIDRWYTPPPGPIPPSRASPWLYQTSTFDITAKMPAPAVEGWVGPSLGWQRRRKLESVSDGQPLLIPKTAIEAWYSPPTDPVRRRSLPPALYPTGAPGPVLVITPDVMPDLYYELPGQPIPPPRLPIALYPQQDGPTVVIGPDSEQVDQWYTPPPDPTSPNRASPWLYQDTTYDATALLPVPPIDRWSVLQPIPIQPVRLPVALYPPGPPEPVVTLTQEVGVDGWYALPSDPIWPRRTTPFLYQNTCYELGAMIPVPPFVSAAPILGVYGSRRPAGRVVMGSYVTPRNQ